MGFTEIIMWIIAIVIVLVLADAVRKILLEKRGDLKVKIDPRFQDIKDDIPDNNILGKPRARQRDVIEQLELGNMDPPLIMDADDGQEDLSPARAEKVLKQSIEKQQGEPKIAVENPEPFGEVTSEAIEEKAAEEPEMLSESTIEEVSHAEKQAAPVAEARPHAPASSILDVIVVHLLFPMAVDGEALLQTLLEQGLRYGEMKIFHAHKGDNLLFSMANAHEPGYFNIDQMEKQQFKAVSFFVRLPGPKEPLAALNRMLETAQLLANQFEGELKDENRISLSQQRMEHMREKVQEFERRQRVGDASRH